MKQSKIKAVVFDAFGTVIKPVPRSAGYKAIFGAAKDLRSARHMALTEDLSLADLALKLQMASPSNEHQCLLNAEIEAITLYDDTVPTIRALKEQGYQVAICSNLAAPYGPKVRELLSDVDEFIFSYEVGFLKPEQGIYDEVLRRLRVDTAEILFIGDTPHADVDGPIKAGMQARLIQRARGDDMNSALSAEYSA